MGAALPAQLTAIEFAPQPGPQAALVGCPIEDVFFGGARGGGKTYGMLLDWLDHALTHGNFATGVFFRRVAKNLEEVIQEAHRIFPHFGGKWRKADMTYVFVSGPAKGARLKFRHLDSVDDANAYQGHAYTWICFEEMTQWGDPTPIDMLRATLRSAYGVPCVFRATGNPGGAGHNWIKARYISPAPRGFKIIVDSDTGERRVFIPSKLDDNRKLMEADPRYEARLRGLGTPTLVRAWRHGDWDIVAGGFFDDLWSEEKHVLRPFELPKTWTFRRSFDWGFAKPSSLGLYAISDGNQPRIPGRQLPFFPRGSIIRIGELYTVQKEKTGIVKPNAGLRWSNERLGEEIAEVSKGRYWSGCVADPSIFTEDGGPSIFSQVKAGARRKGHALKMGEADNTRVAGWSKCRTMMEAARDDDREVPGFWAFENCVEFIRTVPVLQMDKKKPDDIDTDAEDHAADEWRYLLMTEKQGAGVGRVAMKGH